MAAYLRAQGVDDIDVMVNSHPDSDHLGGLYDLLRTPEITVNAIVYGGYAGVTTLWYDFTTQVASRGLTLTPAQYPETFSWGAMDVSVLNPQPSLVNPESNDASVVLLIKHGEVSFLFPGDILITQENKIMALGTPVAADILKVAHHGSEYSSGVNFLAAVAPTDATVSGGTNSDGSPDQETLDRLLAIGARIWRTDLIHTIVVVSDGATYTIHGTSFLNLPVIFRQLPTETPSPTPTQSESSLKITALSGTTAPEYVNIQNFGTEEQDMTGWTLFSVVGSQTYNFPAGYILNPGATVSIQSYTGAIDNPPAVLLWNYSAIWNDNGDIAELRNASNVVVDSKCYGNMCP